VEYWVYENWTHDFAKVHISTCSYCNAGRGMHAGSTNANGKWHGPYDDRERAFVVAKNTGRQDVRGCKPCSP
jgi:uncharacterized Fe-S cluster-containing radical SAM superfamily protein